MKCPLPDYETIDRRLLDAVIPDYGINIDNQILQGRGKEIKSLFPALHDWPEARLAEFEMYLEDTQKIDKRIRNLTLPGFLTLLFNPECRANWGIFPVHCFV